MPSVDAKVSIEPAKLAEFCQRHHIRKLALFGSVLRDDFRDDSDVDILVELKPGHPVGLIRLGGIELEISQLLGRRVDLRTPEDLSPYFRQQVLESAAVQYAQR